MWISENQALKTVTWELNNIPIASISNWCLVMKIRTKYKQKSLCSILMVISASSSCNNISCIHTMYIFRVIFIFTSTSVLYLYSRLLSVHQRGISWQTKFLDDCQWDDWNRFTVHTNHYWQNSYILQFFVVIQTLEFPLFIQKQ